MTVLPSLEDVQKIAFGANGNSGRHTRAGWSGPEAGFRWMTGPESRLVLQVPDAAADYMLLLGATPFIVKPAVPAQLLTVQANGYALAEHTILRPRTLPVYLPAAALDGKPDVELVLLHPDARRVSDVLPVADNREIAISLTTLRLLRLTEAQIAPPADLPPPGDRPLLLLFESLGETDAFVRVQRALGVDPIGLLRGADVPIAAAIDMLASHFADLDSPKRLVVTPGEVGGTWTVRHKTYPFSYTTAFDTEDPAAVMSRETARLTIGGVKMRRVLADGDRILVFAPAAPLADEELIPLLVAARDRGPNTLLWVTEAAEGVAPGTVEPVMEGMLRGHVRHMRVPEGVTAGDVAGWLAMCRNAWRHWDRRSTGLMALAS